MAGVCVLVVFGKQLFTALAGSGSNGGLVVAALDNFHIKVRAGRNTLPLGGV